jgi:predicted ATPase
VALHWRSVNGCGNNQGKWCEAEIHRVAGEIALLLPEPDAAKAEAYFERALAVARKQQAKSWELRAAMSMARLWRDQGKRDAARNLLAPGLRLVHRRLRYARSERGQDAARRAASLTSAFKTALVLLQRMSLFLARHVTCRNAAIR